MPLFGGSAPVLLLPSALRVALCNILFIEKIQKKVAFCNTLSFHCFTVLTVTVPTVQFRRSSTVSTMSNAVCSDSIFPVAAGSARTAELVEVFLLHKSSPHTVGEV